MGNTCTATVTDVASYTLVIAPQPQRKWGWKRDLPDLRDRILRFSAAAKAGLPRAIDLRPREHFPIYEQGTLGSCTANALGAAFHFAQIQQGLTGFVPSRLFLYFNEREMEGSIDEDAGAYIRDGVKSLCQQGICSEVHWPYIESSFMLRPSNAAYEEAGRNRAQEYARVPQTLEDMKACIASGFPFVFGFLVYFSFQSIPVALTGNMSMPWACCDSVRGGHAVMACGYDDERRVFIVRNSWGSGWGDRGYFYMPYDYIVDPELVEDLWAVKVVESGDFPSVPMHGPPDGRHRANCLCGAWRGAAARPRA